MKIQVLIKNVYGNEMVYPVCENARTFASMVGMKTLPDHVLSHIKRLGYTIEVVQAKVSL